MYGGSSKLGRGAGRGGGGGGGGGPIRNRNSFPLPTNRHPSPVGRMSSGGGASAATRHRNTTTTTSVKAAALASSRTVEETFSLVPRESPSAFGMIIRLTPDLVDEIKRVEAEGESAKIKFDAFPNNSTGNIINVGGKEFKFTWSKERGDLCDIYEEHQSGEDGDGVLIEAGCAWRKLNIQRTLDESTTSHVKMRSVEAEQRTKSRKAIVLDPGNPSLTKQLALAEASPWRMSNKQKKEPPPKKRKVDPPPVPIGGPKPSFRPGASTPAMKNRLSASPGPSPPNRYNTPSSHGVGNIAKTHAAKENVTQTKGRENMVASEKNPSWENNALRDTSGRQVTNVNKEIDLQSLLIDLLNEAPMSLKALEKAVGDKIPNAVKKIEPILKEIAKFQAPRYYLKSGAELEGYKKHSPDSGGSPEHQQLLPINERTRNQLYVPGSSNMEKVSVCEQNGDGSKDCLPVNLAEQLSVQENVDIEHHSPGIHHEEKQSENREGQARSSSDSDSDSDNSDSASDSGSSSDSEASSNSKEGSDEDVDIMSDGDKELIQTVQSVERDAIDLPGHGSDAVDIDGHDSDAVDIDGHDSDAVDMDGHDSDAVDIDGHGSDAVDIEGNSSDEFHGSEAGRKNFSGNWKVEAAAGSIPTANENGILGQELFAPAQDNLRERQNFIGQLFDDTENTTKYRNNEQPDISERLAKDQNQTAPDLEHYSQQTARVKNMKSQSFSQLPAIGKDSQPSERKYDVELLNASASQTMDPHRGLQNSFIEKSNRHGQTKPVDSIGKSNKHSDALGNVRKSDEGDHFSHEMLSSRSGKAFRDNQRDDVYMKNKFPKNKIDGESAIRPSLTSDTSNRKHGELDGNKKNSKNVSGLSIDSSPLDSQRANLANLSKGNGHVLQKQVSELELGELPERLGEDTALKQLEEKSSYRQSNLKPSTSENLGVHLDKRRSKKSDSKKPAPSHANNGIKELPEHVVEDSERSQKWVLQSHGQNLTGTDTEIGSQNKSFEDAAYKSRQKDSRARVGNSLEGSGETNKKAPSIKHGSKRPSTSRSSRESKRHASGTIANSINGHKDATSIQGDSVVHEKRMQSFDEEDFRYLKYETASPGLKGPISDYSQYEAYVQEYADKYDSYYSVYKILETYRNDFEKLGEDLGFAKGRDIERYNKIVEQIKESYCIHGERHKRLKKVFVVLHEEMQQLKQRIKDYASSLGKK